jgi:hypothetical protein
VGSIDEVAMRDGRKVLAGRASVARSMDPMKCALALGWLLSCVVLSTVVFAQDTERPRRVEFKSYEFSQFITSAGQSPQQVTALDNNGEILLACTEGRTEDQLRASGVRFAESQIELLKTWRLMEEKDAVLKTAFPILGEEMSQRLRGASRAIVPALGRQLEPDVTKLVALLDHGSRKRNAYTILFSYILDDLVWDRFSERKLIGRRVITAEEPLWAGEVWAVYPPRSFSMGTNSVSDKGISLKVNWTERAIPKMGPFVADIKTFLRMFDDYVGKGRVEDAEAMKVFGPFGLFDRTGQFTVPVITAKRGDPLFDLSDAIARKVAQAVPSLLDLGGLCKQFGFRDGKQALVVAYHEVMWDLMDHLEGEGIVEKPLAFADPDNAKPADIGDLVFIVRKPGAARLPEGK